MDWLRSLPHSREGAIINIVICSIVGVGGLALGFTGAIYGWALVAFAAVGVTVFAVRYRRDYG